MNYKEKVRHMTKMGIPKSKIIKEKVPLRAENVLKSTIHKLLQWFIYLVQKMQVD